MMRHRINLNGLWLLGIVISAFGTEAEAQGECTPVVGQIVSFEGLVHVQRHGAAALAVSLSGPAGAEICVGDVITVGERSRAAVALVNGIIERWDQNTTARIGNTTARIGAIAEGESSWLDLLSGAIQFFSWRPRELTVTTPFLNAAVEGTEFVVRVEANRASVAVLTGRVRASNTAGSVSLAASQAAVARAGEAPQIELLVRPTDAVQWTLSYPPIFLDPLAAGAPAAPVPLLGRVSERLQQGDVAGALDLLAADPTDPRLALSSASLLLSVGRVEEARREIDRALVLDPQNGEAHALRAVIAVAQNERPMALEAGQRAVELSPASAAARIALSYALQADFRLEEARDQLLEAVRQNPGNALAQARLAELWLALGYRDRAAEAAGQAAAATPDLSQAQSVLGFADLARLDVDEARTAFDKAITLDPSAAQARLGLGLAKIRRGDLAEGRREIEIAAGLDPSNALIRTYLGKAYYEERRSDLAERQFESAKAADPLDPTAYLYSAINLQSQNRPVEALQDAQRSIALNDNRLVYRSRLLIEDDRATRGAALARIYNDLGFEQLALVEGARSVQTSPGNSGAHRFLSETYAALPRHEIARVSEWLQSQLHQPLNIYPVRPQFAERDVFVLEGTGPSALALNEFNPLFARDGVMLQVNGKAGTQDTWGDDAVIAGLVGRFAVSAGQFHYQTEGFRANNDQQQSIYNLFAQAQLSDDTNVQAEFRHRNSDHGDLYLRFFPEAIANSRYRDETRSLRFGFRWDLSPNSQIIGNLRFEKFHQEDSDILDGSRRLRREFNNVAYHPEFQYIKHGSQFNWLIGGGYLNISGNEILRGPPMRVIPADLSDYYLYFYSDFNISKNTTVALGLSGDIFHSGFQFIECNQLNPKLGLTWTPLPMTTIRAAVFRSLVKSWITNLRVAQTIEPTTVAGFNQVFDDYEGTDAWRYGVAVDQDLSKMVGSPLFAGAEFSWRNLKVPERFLLSARRTPMYFSWKEKIGRAYTYWTPDPSWSFSAEYLYEQFDRDSESFSIEGFGKLRTHRFILGAQYFDRSGFRVGATATLVDQSGTFYKPAVPVSGNDHGIVVDGLIGYRFLNRIGSIILTMRNIFDQRFKFQDTDPANPRILPERQFILSMSLAL